MTRKEKLIAELVKVLTDNGVEEIRAWQIANNHRRQTMSDIKYFIESTVKKYEDERKKAAIEEYFQTQCGSQKKAQLEAENEEIKNKIAEIYEDKVAYINKLFENSIPSIFPYHVSLFRYGYYPDTTGQIVLSNKNSKRKSYLDIEIIKDTHYSFDKPEDTRITINVSAIGSVDINDINNDGRAYYQTIGELFKYNNEITQIFDLAIRYRHEEIKILWNKAKENKKWLENPFA